MLGLKLQNFYKKKLKPEFSHSVPPFNEMFSFPELKLKTNFFDSSKHFKPSPTKPELSFFKHIRVTQAIELRKVDFKSR